MVEGQDVRALPQDTSDFETRGTLVAGGWLRPKSERTTDPASNPLTLSNDDGRFKYFQGPEEVSSAVLPHQGTRSALPRLIALRRLAHR